VDDDHLKQFASIRRRTEEVHAIALAIPSGRREGFCARADDETGWIRQMIGIGLGIQIQY